MIARCQKVCIMFYRWLASLFPTKMPEPAVEVKKEEKKLRLTYCFGDSPSDNSEPYFSFPGLYPGNWVKICGKPGKPNRRPKEAVYIGVLRRRYKNKIWVALSSASGQKFRRPADDVLSKAS